MPITAPAHAYRTGADLLDLDSLERVRWQRSPVVLVLSDGGPIDEEATEAVLREAMQQWSGARCGSGLLVSDGVVSSDAEPSDGLNTIQWVTSGWSDYGPDDAAAATDVEYEERGGTYSIVEADIYLNAETIVWADLGQGPIGKAPLSVVLAHELGHVLGLAHPCELDNEGDAPRCDDEEPISSLMHPLYAAGQNALYRDVTADDNAALCFLYEEVVATSDDADADEDAGLSEDESRPDAAVSSDDELADFGEPCMSADDCAQNQCLAGYSSCGGICTRTCEVGGDACPYGYACTVVGERTVCAPAPADDSASCATRRPARHSRQLFLGALLCAVLGLGLRRNKRLSFVDPEKEQ